MAQKHLTKPLLTRPVTTSQRTVRKSGCYVMTLSFAVLGCVYSPAGQGVCDSLPDPVAGALFHLAVSAFDRSPSAGVGRGKTGGPTSRQRPAEEKRRGAKPSRWPSCASPTLSSTPRRTRKAGRMTGAFGSLRQAAMVRESCPT